MATYKEIHGVKVQSLDSDPTALEGDVWYNRSTGLLKMYAVGAGAWASGGNLPGNWLSAQGFGSLTAGVIAGGDVGGSDNAEAFHYNGSAWTAAGNINTQRGGGHEGGYGTQTAGAIVGGHHPGIPTGISASHETYDGSSWTEAGDLNTGRGYHATADNGTTTAALAFSGLINPELAPSPFGAVGFKTESEEYNGTAWTEGSDLSAGRQYISGAGIQTAALAIGGHAPGVVDSTESYDGSSWTEVSDLNTARARVMGGGSQTIAVAAGGSAPSYIGNTEQWNGTSWTEVANISSARGTGASAFTAGATDGLVAGGYPATNATEEWTSDIASQTIAFD